MSGGAGIAVALGCILAVNLLPAFGPPTWAVLVFFSVTWSLPVVPLVVGGALAAASGRFLLASASGRLRHRFSPARLESRGAARAALTGDRRRAAGGLALFALSPVPSAQLFVAAGLLAVPLVPLTAAFFAGRLVSYAAYVSGASRAADELGETFTGVFTSPAGMAAQLAMLAGLVVLLRVPLVQLLSGRTAKPVGDDRTYGELATPAGLADIATYADGVGPSKDYIVPRNADGSSAAPTSFVDDAHAAGLLVHPYTFRRENSFLPLELRSSSDPAGIGDLAAEITQFLELGVDGFFTDNPDIGRAAVDAFAG